MLILPFSLLTFIIPFTTAIPVGQQSSSFSLGSVDFKGNVSSGTWLIEFFSPFCGHCRNFAPTWIKIDEQVQEEAKNGVGKTLGVKLAQVDCVVNGDLCSDENIRGYPTLRVYKDGNSVAEFNEDRTTHAIIDFIAKHAPQPTTAPPTTTAEKSQEEDESVLVVQTRSKHDVNPQGIVVNLTPKDFDSFADSDGVFIKFYAPWCGHCKKLAPIWTQLGHKLQNKMTVAEVNCDDHKALCKSQGVEGFPMLFFYRHGNKLDYTGKRTLEAMESFVHKIEEPVVKKMAKSQSLSDIMKEQEVVFVFLHLTVDGNALSLVEGAGNTALMTPAVHLYTTVSPSLRSQFGQTTPGPALFVLKASPGAATPTLDALKPHASMVITKQTSRANIHEFLERHKFGLVTELDSDNFQSIMNAKVDGRQVALLATTPETKISDVNVLRAAETRWSSSGDATRNDVLWVHMDGDKWGSWMKGMYGLRKANMPSFVVSLHSKLKYFDRYQDGKPFELSAEGLVKAVTQSTSGILTPRNSENIFERFARSTNRYATAFADLFVTYPFRMVWLIVVVIALLAWFVSKIISEDVGGGRHNGPHSYEKAKRVGLD